MGILDSLTASAVAAYSIRKLRTAYSGNVVKIRRSSDNNEVDVAFDTNETISGSSAVSPTTWGSTLSAFADLTGTPIDCFVTTKYDQTTGGYNATQSTATNQPQIVDSSGLRVDANGNVKLTYSTDQLQTSSGGTWTQPNTISTVAQWSSTTSTNSKLFDGETTNRNMVLNNNNTLSMFAGIVVNVGTTSTNQNIRTFLYDGSSSKYWENGTQIGTTYNAGSGSLTGITLGAAYNRTDQGMVGDIQELIIFNSDIGSTDRTTLEDDQDAYYLATGITIEHTAGVVTLNSNSHTITTTASVDIEHTAGVVNLDSNTHTVFGADAIEITHTAGTVNGDSNTHTITIGDNIEISHTAGVVNLDSNTHTIFITNPVEITHTAGVVNLDSNTHTVFGADAITITHTAGVLNGETTSVTVGTEGTVVITHTAGVLNGDSIVQDVLGVNPIVITHTAGVVNGDSNSHTVGTLAIDFVTNMRQSILFGGENDTRVFMFGKDNKVIYSELADGLPSAEYFPASNSILVSSDNFDVTGLTKQYDRLVIHKENEAHYCQYEISSTLGTIFSVFPLNDTIGNRAFGETRLILNNPFTVHDGVYQYSGTNVRDERNAVLMSERVQLGLDTLDLTQAVTFDFEKNFEYFIAVGNIVYVYNYKVDAWYKYELTDTPTCFVEIEGEAYFGTSTGAIMKFDAEEFTDDGTIFTAEWETGFMNFGANWLRKFLTYGWLTLKPEGRASVEVNWETDQGANSTPYLMEYKNMDYSNVDYSDWSYATNYSPKPFREKFKIKKYSTLKIKGKNETSTDKMTILSITLPAVTGGQVK